MTKNKNHIEILSLEQNNIEVAITENFYKSLKNIMNSKDNASNLSGFILSRDYEDGCNEEVFNIAIPYSSLGVKSYKTKEDILGNSYFYNADNHFYTLGVRKQRLYDYMYTHTALNLGGKCAEDIIKNVDEYVYTFYIHSDEEWWLEHKYFHDVVSKTIDLFNNQRTSIKNKKYFNELLEILNEIKHSVDAIREDNGDIITFKINPIGSDHLIAALSEFKNNLNPSITVYAEEVGFGYFSVELLNYDMIEVVIKEKTITFEGRHYIVDEDGELECDEGELFKINELELYSILQHLYSTFSEYGKDSASVLLENILKLA